MDKKDYFVIVYKILLYLYECLKEDKPVDEFLLTPENFDIPKRYWGLIIKHLYYSRSLIDLEYSPRGTVSIEGIEITGQGIEYLFENPMMRKVRESISDLRE